MGKESGPKTISNVNNYGLCFNTIDDHQSLNLLLLNVSLNLCSNLSQPLLPDHSSGNLFAPTSLTQP